MPCSRLGVLTLLSLSFASLIHTFTFVYNQPTQCDPFTISWTGGSAPFELLLTPVFDNPRNFSIPSSDGNYSLQLPLSAGQQFIVVMSDATGFGMGGVSDILTVGNSISGAPCSTQIPTPSFQFELDSQLRQCASYNISGYVDAVQPVTITGLVPLGSAVQLTSGTGQPWYLWNQVNVPAGTSLVFFLTDHEGRFGGSSHVVQVADSDNNSCLGTQSVRTTASEGPTVIGSPTTTIPSPSATPTPNSGKISPAAIGGAVVGGLVALLILATLSIFFFRTYLPTKTYRFFNRYKSDKRQSLIPAAELPSISADTFSQLASNRQVPQHTQWTTFTPAFESNHHLTPYPILGGAVGEHVPNAVVTESGQAVLSSMRQDGSQVHRSSKSSYPASQRPTRLVLHVDAEDEDEIELPPQYIDRRTGH